MAHFAAAFGLNLSQAELDFVDVNIETDNRLYLDPYAIQIKEDEWSNLCGDHITSFFNEVLDALRQGNDARARHLLNHLHEPNETFLGQSKGTPRGRGLGRDKATDVASALKRSKAFSTGLLSDISEAELFISGIGPDTISDLTTNILRGVLADYTAIQCANHNIETSSVTDIGPVWSTAKSDWQSIPLNLPIVNGNPVLLIPKYSVRRALSLNSQEFYNHYMVAFLRQEYLDSRSSLVQVFKRSKKEYVTKKSVKEKHPFVKDDLATFVQKHPEILETYKKIKGAKGPLDNKDLDAEFDDPAFASALIQRLDSIPTGNDSATTYHSVAMGICTFLFYPHLICPIKERELHQGRKRVDIKFTNAADSGFFLRMLQAQQTRSLSVIIECKNYSNDPGNPEFDQLCTRFGHQRGFFGMLLCRKIDNRAKSISSCKDTANDGRGYIIVLDDKDLKSMLSMVESGTRSRIDGFLQAKFDEITH